MVTISESENPELQEMEKNDANPSDRNESSSPTGDSVSKAKVGNILDKAVDILKRKTPALTDKELNPEFFLKLETRGSGDLPVEVIVPRRYLSSSKSGNEEESGLNVAELRGRFTRTGNGTDEFQGSSRSKPEREISCEDWRLRSFHDDKIDESQGESTAPFTKAESKSEGGSSKSNKGNMIAIQRQLLQLERQQTHLMSMLQVLSKNAFCCQKLPCSCPHK